MNYIIYICIAVCLFFSQAQGQQKGEWKIQSLPIQTRWSAEVSPMNNLNEYPRPQLARKSWTNLNGLWDYAITVVDSTHPTVYDGKILVPYPIESALSGVKKSLSSKEILWYRRNLSKPSLKAGERVILNFGAIDYEAYVYINGCRVGSHVGGYTAFSFDITDFLVRGNNELLLKVYDPTEQGVGPHGKQASNPKDIYYSSSSGIWQTVWMEVVPETHIERFSLMPDIDRSELSIDLKLISLNRVDTDLVLEVVILDNGTEVWSGSIKGSNLNKITAEIPTPKLWSPSNPFLYDLIIRLKRTDQLVDEVKSYFGMRKISIAKDSKGLERIFLNNRPYFNLGTLDQGFWPDGLYTAPTDDALAFDIKAIKAMGFNTIRKHIKIEPSRWYYHADRIGVLVWQDMVNPNQTLPVGAKQAFEDQLKETIQQLYNYPCITTWVLFNEKWGQYDQDRLTQLIKELDHSRLVNGHSGEFLYTEDKLRSPSYNPYVGADMTDVHSYPYPMMSLKEVGKARVCGEFGGIGVFIPGHQWNTESPWGYIQESPASFESKYAVMVQHLKLLEKEGLSGSIYTQPFDVEGEQNGLMTYDREIIKIPFQELRKIHHALNPISGRLPDVIAKHADLQDPNQVYSELLDKYVEGNRDTTFLLNMAFYATQVGDIPGATLAANSYISTLRNGLSEEQIRFIAKFTKSIADPGYELMVKNELPFKNLIGERKYRVLLMNMIMRGEIEPILNVTEKPDWNEIERRTKVYGDVGEEIFNRSKTLSYYNAQDWENFVPAALIYLEKYAKVIKASDKNMLQEAVNKYKH